MLVYISYVKVHLFIADISVFTAVTYVPIRKAGIETIRELHILTVMILLKKMKYLSKSVSMTGQMKLVF